MVEKNTDDLTFRVFIMHFLYSSKQLFQRVLIDFLSTLAQVFALFIQKFPPLFVLMVTSLVHLFHVSVPVGLCLMMPP